MVEPDDPLRPATPDAQSSPVRTLLVTLAICLACSLIVSVATVLLRPIRAENERLARESEVADVLETQPSAPKLDGGTTATTREELVVDLRTGAPVAGLDPAELDALEAARDPSTSRAIPPAEDIARIGRQAHHAVVTVVRENGAPRAIVLPIYGRGYGSLIRGSIVLAGDGNTITGLIIREHGETPGIGSEITRSDWLRQWVGKKLRDEQGRFRFRVKTAATKDGESGPFQVDGISGATRSSEGVGNMVRFWLGDDGFGPLLERLRRGEL